MNPAALIVWALTVRRAHEPEPKALDETHIVQLYVTEKSCNEDLTDFTKNPTSGGPLFACLPVKVADISVHEDSHKRSQK